MVAFCVVGSSLEDCTGWIDLPKLQAVVFFLTPTDRAVIRNKDFHGTSFQSLPVRNLDCLIPVSRHFVVQLSADYKRDLIACLPEVCAFLDRQFSLEEGQMEVREDAPAAKANNSKESVILLQCGHGMDCGVFTIVAYLMRKWRIPASQA